MATEKESIGYKAFVPIYLNILSMVILLFLTVKIPLSFKVKSVIMFIMTGVLAMNVWFAILMHQEFRIRDL